MRRCIQENKADWQGPRELSCFIPSRDSNQKHFQKHILTFLQETRNPHTTALPHEQKHLVKMSLGFTVCSPPLSPALHWECTSSKCQQEPGPPQQRLSTATVCFQVLGSKHLRIQVLNAQNVFGAGLLQL